MRKCNQNMVFLLLNESFCIKYLEIDYTFINFVPDNINKIN